MRDLHQVLSKYGDVVEADLAFRGIDLRDLYRRESGLTPRRLWALIRHLPRDAMLWPLLEQERATAAKQAATASPDAIRARARVYGQTA